MANFSKIFFGLIVVIIILSLNAFKDFSFPSFPAPTSAPTPVPNLYRVTQVVDGDTIKVDINGQIETIRLIGVDTPETVDPRQPVGCFGREASANTQNLVGGKNVRLESDPTQGDRDRYQRLLRYVYLQDGTLLNHQIIAQGFGFEYTYNLPYKFQSEFKAAQQQAESQELGLWDDVKCDYNQP